MQTVIFGPIKSILKILFYIVVSGCIILISVVFLQLKNLPDLKIWHKAELDGEFTAENPIQAFNEYLELETKLFQELEKKVYAHIEPEDQHLANRYHKGSLSDPDRWTPNWNRSFELPAEKPQAGALLLHGMSDSPYSLHHVGQRLNEAGVWTVGLRLPGHGTVPSGLVEVKWEDMAAAVRLAVSYLSGRIGNAPLYIVGYSNGGALGVYYVLQSLKDGKLPKASGLVLISPAIGVSPLAALAVWQGRIGHFFGIEKLAWNSIIPEYDPFKYQSFAVNAGDQVYRLTTEIQRLIGKLGAAGELQHFPPVLIFQSVTDATVSAKAVIDGLLARLPAGGHELVLFDINRSSETKQVLMNDPLRDIEGIFSNLKLPFAVRMITNDSDTSDRVVVLHKEPNKRESKRIPLGLKWPREVYSLSHIALLFPFDDPLYGGSDRMESPGIVLGTLALRGERGLLQIPAADMLRLRWNPFYSYLEQRMLGFLDLKNTESPDSSG